MTGIAQLAQALGLDSNKSTAKGKLKSFATLSWHADNSTMLHHGEPSHSISINTKETTAYISSANGNKISVRANTSLPFKKDDVRSDYKFASTADFIKSWPKKEFPIIREILLNALKKIEAEEHPQNVGC